MSKPTNPYPVKTEDGLIDIFGNSLEITGDATIDQDLTVKGYIYGTVLPVLPIGPQQYFTAYGSTNQYRVIDHANFDFSNQYSTTPTFNFYNSSGVTNASTINAGTFSGQSASLSSLSVSGSTQLSGGPITIQTSGYPLQLITNNSGDNIDITSAATGNININSGTAGVISLDASLGSISLNAGLAIEISADTFTSISAGTYLSLTGATTASLSAGTSLTLAGAAIEILASGVTSAGTVQIGTDAGLLSLTALVGGITLTAGAGALSMIAGTGGVAIDVVAGAIAISTTLGIVSISGTTIQLNGPTTISSILYIENSSSEYVEITVPSSFSSYTFGLPATPGSTGQVLTSSNGSTLTWSTLPFTNLFQFQPVIGCVDGTNQVNIYQQQAGYVIPIGNIFFVSNYIIYIPYTNGDSSLSIFNFPYLFQSTKSFSFISSGFYNITGAKNFSLSPQNNNSYLNGFINAGQSSLPIPTTGYYLRTIIFSSIFFNTSGTSFSPTVYGSTTTGTFTYSNQKSQYYSFGNITYFEISMTVTPTSSPTGNLVVSTPFTFANVNTNAYFDTSYSLAFPSGCTDIIAVNNSSSTILLKALANGSYKYVPISSSPFNLTVSGSFMNNSISTFTPMIYGSSSTGTYSYTVQKGEYTNYGLYSSNGTFYQICVSLSFSVTSAGSGNLNITLPANIFPPSLATTNIDTNIYLPSGYTMLKGLYQQNIFTVYACAQNQPQTHLQIPKSGTFYINFNIFYHS